MALSVNTLRALEQTKMGLFMLYGAGYFTEEEWMKLDFLIHKGRYVFTQGPPKDDSNEPLMTFEEPTNNTNGYVQIDTTGAFDEKKSPVITEEELPSPTSPQPNSQSGNNQFPAETLNAPSAEGPEEEQVALKPTDDVLFDFAKMSEPSASPEPAKQQLKAPIEGRDKLPPGCTQEQLDEVKRFNAGLTKAGQKSRPKYNVEIEEETRIKSWASEVDAEAKTYPDPIQSHLAQASRPVQSSHTHPEIASPAPTSKSKKPNPEVLAKEFTMVYGRKPKSINDFYQPKNPGFRPKHPESLNYSMTTTKTATSTAPSSLQHGNYKLNIPPGTILVAQSGVSKKSSVSIEVLPGDRIKLINYVSGITHIGENLRTNKTGQFPDTIFKKAPGNNASDLAMQRRTVSTSVKSNLDALERIHAAEWDDVSAASKLTAAAVRKPQGLQASKFSVANMDDDDAKTSVSRQGITPSMVREEVKKMFDQRAEEFLRANGMLATIPTTAPARATSYRHNSSIYEEPEKLIPKTHTCWFWSTPGKTCRFTAEECRDLHAEGGQDPYLRNGKPTWGALVDYLPSPTTASETSPIAPNTTEKNLTCWYWAQGNCVNTSQTCKYAHAFTYGGVAKRPWHKPVHWNLETWKRGEKKEKGDAEDEQAEGEGDFVIEEAGSEWGNENENDAPAWEREEFQTSKSWSESQGWAERPSDGKYKPPHVKAQQTAAIW